MLTVLRPVALDHFPLAVVALDGEGDAEHVVAGLDDAQDAADAVPPLLHALAGAQPLHQLVLHDAGAAVEEALHHLEEVGVVLLVGRFAVVPPRAAAPAPHGRRTPGRRRRRPARLRARQHSAAGQAGEQLLPQVKRTSKDSKTGAPVAAGLVPEFLNCCSVSYLHRISATTALINIAAET